MQPSPIPPPNTVTLAVWLLYRHLRGHTHSVYDKYCQPTLTKPAAPSRAQSLSGQTRLHTQVMPGPGLGSSLTIPALPPRPETEGALPRQAVGLESDLHVLRAHTRGHVSQCVDLCGSPKPPWLPLRPSLPHPCLWDELTA